MTKRLLLLAFLLPSVLLSCKKDETNQSGGKASIVIESNIDKGVDEIVTRAGEENGYWLTVTGPEGFTPMAQLLGTLRTIPDLEYGEYTVTLSSLKEEDYNLPAYNRPIYRGSATKTLFSGTPTPFQLKCSQMNVGIQFIFDESVTTYYTAPVATVTNSKGESLSLAPADYGDKKAYFEAGTLTISLADGSSPILIGGEPSKAIETTARELWTITLKTSSKEGGDIDLDIEIDTGTTEQKPEFGVGEVTGDGSGENPFSVGAAINAMPRSYVWVQGVITGRTTINPLTRSSSIESIRISQTSTSPEKESIVVELPAGSDFRAALNLDDPDYNDFIGMRIAVRGNVQGKAADFTSNAFASITEVSGLQQNFLPENDVDKSINYRFSDKVLKTSIPRLPIGTAINHESIENDPMYVRFLKRDFNSVTSEYNMKMGTIWKEGRDQWNFIGSDKIVNFALANGMRVHGHTLIWSQTSEIPQWMQDLTWADEDPQWTALMKEYITKVVTRYAGKVASWDVVNEAFNDYDGSYRGSGTNDGYPFWYQKVGPGFIRIAFETARQALADAGDTNCKLFYNDYDFVNTAKRNGVIANLQPLVDDGTIDGIGMQMHLKVRPERSKVDAAFIAVAGMRSDLLIHASEIDMLINNQEFIDGAKASGWISGNYATKEEMYDWTNGRNFNLDYAQGKSYNTVVYSYLEKVPAAQQYGVSTWGFTDKGWVEQGIVNHEKYPDFPMMFAADYQKKRAYDGVIEALNGVSWDTQETEGGAEGWKWRWINKEFEPKAPWD